MTVKSKAYGDEFANIQVDLVGICAERVVVGSWCHSGPVGVTLEGVRLKWLLDAIDRDLLSRYLKGRKKDKLEDDAEEA